MVKLFTCKIFIIKLLLPALFTGLVSFLYASELEIQCSQVFAPKHALQVDYQFDGNLLDFKQIHHQCVANPKIQITVRKKHQIIYQTEFRRKFILSDAKFPAEQKFQMKEMVPNPQPGNYEVFISVEENSFYVIAESYIPIEPQNAEFQVNDIVMKDGLGNFIFQSCSKNEKSIQLIYNIKSDFEFPLTIKTNIFSLNKEQKKELANSYISIVSKTNTLALKKGLNQMQFEQNITDFQPGRFLIEVYFFDGEVFKSRKSRELTIEENPLEYQLKMENLLAKYQLSQSDKQLILEIWKKISLEMKSDFYNDLEKYLLISKNSSDKLRSLLKFGLPDKQFFKNYRRETQEVWVYYKINKMIFF